ESERWLGLQAASLQVAERYIDAFGKVAKESTTLLLPTDASNPASMVAQALSIFKRLNGQDPGKSLLSKSITDSKIDSHENHSITGFLLVKLRPMLFFAYSYILFLLGVVLKHLTGHGINEESSDGGHALDGSRKKSGLDPTLLVMTMTMMMITGNGLINMVTEEKS
nr:stomatin-like protein 2, mitochondrial [Tanacetum cinerariifolium]